MSRPTFKSLVRTGDNPPIYVPQALQTPMTLKRFWYVPIFQFTVKVWRWLTSPFRKKTEPKIDIEAPEGVDVKLEIKAEVADE